MHFNDTLFKKSSKKQSELTTWTNNSEHVVRFCLLSFEAGINPEVGTPEAYQILPGESLTLPATYDQAIRKTDRYGKIIGGKCPWLTKEGEKHEPEMLACLDFEAVEDKIRATAIAKKLDEDKVFQVAMDYDKRKFQDQEQEKRGKGRPKGTGGSLFEKRKAKYLDAVVQKKLEEKLVEVDGKVFEAVVGPNSSLKNSCQTAGQNLKGK